MQYDLSQQIRVDFEKSFSVKGAPVSYKKILDLLNFLPLPLPLSLSLSLSPQIGTKHQLHDACKVMDILGGRKKYYIIIASSPGYK